MGDEEDNDCDSTNFLRKFLALTPAAEPNSSSVLEKDDVTAATSMQNCPTVALQSIPQAKNTHIHQPIQQPTLPLQVFTATQANLDNDTVKQKAIISQNLTPTPTIETALETLQPLTHPSEEDDDTGNGQSNFLSTFLGLPSASGWSLIPQSLQTHYSYLWTGGDR